MSIYRHIIQNPYPSILYKVNVVYVLICTNFKRRVAGLVAELCVELALIVTNYGVFPTLYKYFSQS